MLSGAARVAAVVSLLAALPNTSGRLLEAPSTLRRASLKVAHAPRLHIISVTDLNNIAVAVGMQRTCKRRMSSDDSYANICDSGCANLSAGALDNVVEMDDSSFGVPLHKSTHMRAELKYAFGLVHEVRRLSRLGGTLPAWWFVKDNSSFVNADRLMAWVDGRANPEDFVSFGQLFRREKEYEGEEQISGGWGWLLSRGMARKLGQELGADVLKFAISGCKDTICHFGGGSRSSHPAQGLPWFAVERIEGGQLENSPAFALNAPCASAAAFPMQECVDKYAKLRRINWTANAAEQALEHCLHKMGC